jgi:protocatechuate 3,4-dioxygenase beta subunit
MTSEAGFSEERSAGVVAASFDGTPDPRLRQVMQSLVRHLHAFVKDVELTEAEWAAAIAFLTATGQKCDDVRQEFVLLSDVLGVSMLVETINHRAGGATESTVLGPFHMVESPARELGATVSLDGKGEPCLVTGRVTGPDGEPLGGASVDVWQASEDGFYDVQQPGIQPESNLRGLFTAAADGTFWFRTVMPRHYPIPDDGRWASCCARPGDIRTGRRTSTFSWVPTGTNRSPRISSSPALRTWTPTPCSASKRAWSGSSKAWTTQSVPPRSAYPIRSVRSTSTSSYAADPLSFPRDLGVVVGIKAGETPIRATTTPRSRRGGERGREGSAVGALAFEGIAVLPDRGAGERLLERRNALGPPASEEAHSPVQHRGQPVLEADQIEQVHDQPDQPAGEPGQRSLPTLATAENREMVAMLPLSK